jgi:hypothetical protein
MVEGSKAHSKEVRARRRTPKGNEGSKAHSKGGRVGNALLLMVEGSKVHSKEMRTRRRTQKEIR